ncbi:MAG: uridine kinase [Candidatus Marinimicrobia bacterium]|nr:uridine kinase [Candidatus Neomarinimicrobiota bacterium]MCH8067898.1 uridine kinase [Candidatus Neomarinimicrobiota bacterium]
MNANILIGIGGGSGSGKSSVAKNILRKFGEGEVTIIEQDSYYHDLSHLPFNERLKTNFDHPDAIDFDLLRSHLKSLLKGETISVPIYDFSTHTRLPDTREIKSHHAIVLEGIMVFTDKILREMMNIKIYVATDPDIRIIRRLTRDIRERGRTFEDVVRQYLDIVRPMHEQFVETTKKFADIIIPEGGDNQVAIDLIQTKIRSLLNN